MRKMEAMVALGLISLLALPALADDKAKGAAPAKGSAPAAATASASAGDKDGDDDAAPKGKRKHAGGHGGKHRRGNVPGKNQVMNVADLSDKQKTQLQAIYDGKKAEFGDLRKQMLALEAAEWKEVQAVLTPAQVEALSGKAAASANTAGSSSAAKDSDAAGDK